MQVVEMPEGLAELPPGPVLGALLAGLDLARVPNEHVVPVLQAQYRQVAHEQARLLSAIVEVGRSTPFSDPEDLRIRALFGVQRLQAVSEWASAEIAAALTLTGMAADREVAFADTVVTRLPLVHAALAGGSIDRAKAWLFAEYLDGDLISEQVAAVCRALVPIASRLTTGQLRARLVRMIHDIDPAHARRRYERAVRGRAVVGHLSPDGTVTVTATGLPADEAAVVCERLDVLAGVVQRAGHPGRLGQIQTDLFLGMLDGTFHHLTEPEVVAAMLGRVRPEDAEPAAGTPAAASSGERPAEHRQSEGGPPPDRRAEDGVAEAGPACGPPRDERAEDGVAHGGPSGGHPGGAAAGAPLGRPAAKGAAGDGAAAGTSTVGADPPRTPRTGVEVRVGLSTVIGLDEWCGEVAGLGPVLPSVARALVLDQLRGAQWRFAVVDPEGHLILAGAMRRRPRSPVSERRGSRGGVVELHVDAELLSRLAADPARSGRWAAVVADIAVQYADRDDGIARLDGRPAARFARAALARHVQVRDRSCCFPGCRRPARKSDLDHTCDHSRGGGTVRCNIGPLCARHHRLKGEGGWVLKQPEPGRFCWVSPLGSVHHSRGDPIKPPTVQPSPRPAGSDRDSGPGRYVDGPILGRPPPQPAPPHHTPADGDDAPPF